MGGLSARERSAPRNFAFLRIRGAVDGHGFRLPVGLVWPETLAGRVHDARIERGKPLARGLERREAIGHREGAGPDDLRVPSWWVRCTLFVERLSLSPVAEGESARPQDAGRTRERSERGDPRPSITHDLEPEQVGRGRDFRSELHSMGVTHVSRTVQTRAEPQLRD